MFDVVCKDCTKMSAPTLLRFSAGSHLMRAALSLTRQPRSYLCTSTSPSNTPTESSIKEKLKSSFPSATAINVEDISGGCGAMFEVMVEDSHFKGMNTLKQHQTVTQALKEHIPSMHGIRINTQVPPDKKKR